MDNNQSGTEIKKGGSNTLGIVALIISIIGVVGCWIPGLNIISMFLAFIAGIIAIISLISAALLKTNRYDKMKNMEDKKICPKCGREEKVKNGFNRGKQRYLCKNCGCNYTGTKNGYSEAVKQEAIKYYMEGMGFRRIERLLHVSHVSVINWVKKAAKKIRENECKKETRSDIIELDEMCISFKKTSGYGQQ